MPPIMIYIDPVKFMEILQKQGKTKKFLTKGAIDQRINDRTYYRIVNNSGPVSIKIFERIKKILNVSSADLTHGQTFNELKMDLNRRPAPKIAFKSHLFTEIEDKFLSNVQYHLVTKKFSHAEMEKLKSLEEKIKTSYELKLTLEDGTLSDQFKRIENSNNIADLLSDLRENNKIHLFVGHYNYISKTAFCWFKERGEYEDTFFPGKEMWAIFYIPEPRYVISIAKEPDFDTLLLRADVGSLEGALVQARTLKGDAHLKESEIKSINDFYKEQYKDNYKDTGFAIADLVNLDATKINFDKGIDTSASFPKIMFQFSRYNEEPGLLKKYFDNIDGMKVLKGVYYNESFPLYVAGYDSIKFRSPDEPEAPTVTHLESFINLDKEELEEANLHYMFAKEWI